MDSINIKISILAYLKIKGWAKHAPGEVSGVGIVEKSGNRLIVSDVFLPTQKCTSGSTNIEGEDLADIIYELDKQGVPAEKVKFWWHSHGSLGVFWSSIDDNTKNTFGSEGYLLSMVVNKAGESLTCLDVYDPFRIVFDRLSVELIASAPASLDEQCRQDVERKVSSSSPIAYYDYYMWGGKSRNGGRYPGWVKNERGVWTKKNIEDPEDINYYIGAPEEEVEEVPSISEGMSESLTILDPLEPSSKDETKDLIEAFIGSPISGKEEIGA